MSKVHILRSSVRNVLGSASNQWKSTIERGVAKRRLSLQSDIEADILKCSKLRQTSISLRTLLETGRGDFLPKNVKSGADTHTATDQVLLQVASFLHREMPIRLAHRVRDLDSIPFMCDMPSVQKVKDWYVHSFTDLRECPVPTNLEDEEHFSRVIEAIYQRHAPTLLTMAHGAHELRLFFEEEKKRGRASKSFGALGLSGGGGGAGGGPRSGTGWDSPGTTSYMSRRGGSIEAFEDLAEVHNFLDTFYMSRIGIRMLIGHYLALREPPKRNYIGLVHTATSPAEVAELAIEDASYMCRRQHGDAPEVTLHGRLDLNFPYVPTHLHYILLELLKNSMRATVEHHMINRQSDNMPPIRVIIADGETNEDISVKVSDEGGGIPRSYLRRIWSYLFTTADPSIQEGFVSFQDSASCPAAADFDKANPLAGLGYGLPISRSYARYFGGDISLVSMEGYGTDAFVHLSRLGNHDEPLS